MRSRRFGLGRLALVIGLAASVLLGPVPTAMSQPTEPPVAPRAQLLGVELEAGCVDSGPAQVRAYPDLWQFGGERFDWALRGAAGSVSSGQVEWWEEDEQYGPLDFALAPGRYRLIITRVARQQVVADRQFDVLRCVRVATSCHAVSFMNPPGNPAVRVEFGGGEYLDEHEEETDKGGTLTVQPGRSVKVETFHEEIWWKAYGPRASRSSPPDAGEHYSEIIDQHCGPTRTRGVISCATGSRGILRAWFHPPNDRRLRYRIDKWNNTPIRDGHPGADRYLRLRPRVGSVYAFRSYTAAAALPYDRAEQLDVVRCVTASRRGQTVKFRNRSGSKVRVAYRIAGRGEKVVLKVKRGASARVRVGSNKVRWHTNALRPTSRWRIDRGRGVLS